MKRTLVHLQAARGIDGRQCLQAAPAKGQTSLRSRHELLVLIVAARSIERKWLVGVHGLHKATCNNRYDVCRFHVDTNRGRGALQVRRVGHRDLDVVQNVCLQGKGRKEETGRVLGQTRQTQNLLTIFKDRPGIGQTLDGARAIASHDGATCAE